MKEEIKKAIAESEELAMKAALKWLAENKPKIGHIIKGHLDDRVEMVAATLLGFNKSWGKWEVDHCNGRAGESSAGDWLKEKAGDAVREWLTEQAGKLPTLNKEAIADLKKEYLISLKQAIRDRLRCHAINEAANAIAQITEDAK